MKLLLFEKLAYRTAVMQAVDLAGMGEVAAGYDRLREGLRRAEALRDAGKPWALSLARQYSDALDRYTARYH